MRIALFVHSLLSCWNHGNAHFLRGVVTELIARGHEVRVYEPIDAWSVTNLVAEHGLDPLDDAARVFPTVRSTRYTLDGFDVGRALDGVDLAIVHEWNDRALVAAIGEHRRRARGLRLLFHDTHHRAVTDPSAMEAYDLRHYDGVLAFGRVLRDLYLARQWTPRAWVWHEAADTRVFRPLDLVDERERADVTWIGNWGDGERTRELAEFLLEPAKRLGLRGGVYGVRYPAEGRAAVAAAGLTFRGWIPNHRVPEVFAAHRVTVHVPRRPYVEALRGIPTIRCFEALACGIPLVTAPWDDVEGLFTPGADFLVAPSGAAMQNALRALLHDRELRRALTTRGLATIHARHTCAHRVDELLRIARELGARPLVDTAPMPHEGGAS